MPTVIHQVYLQQLVATADWPHDATPLPPHGAMALPDLVHRYIDHPEALAVLLAYCDDSDVHDRIAVGTLLRRLCAERGNDDPVPQLLSAWLARQVIRQVMSAARG